jgi:hypothetical protein
MEMKYTQNEIERRWWVDHQALAALTAGEYVVIEDRYITGTDLRLRRMIEPTGEVTLKLGKKYARVHPWVRPITNIYLSPEDYAALASLPAKVLTKRRYRVEGGALDVPDEGDPRYEVEFTTLAAAAEFSPPSFVGAELVEPA